MEKSMTSSLAVGVGIGVVIGWFLRGKFRNQLPALNRVKKMNEVISNTLNNQLDLSDSSPSLSDDGEFKMVIVVRTDLKMGRGKAAAQCAHGALGAAEKAYMKNSDAFHAWKSCGQPKVVVKTDSEESLLQLSKEAAKLGLTCSIIRDAGRTQIPSGSRTVLAVGPGPASMVDKVTGHLKLY